MKEIAVTVTKDKLLCPWHDDDRAAVSEFKTNQPFTVKIYGMGAKKERSVKALGLLMACCKEVALNTEDKHWNTKEKVKKQIKVETNFIDMTKTIVDRHGDVHLHYRSFDFKSLPHMESVGLFEQAHNIMAKKLGCTVDELVAAAKDKMGPR